MDDEYIERLYELQSELKRLRKKNRVLQERIDELEIIHYHCRDKELSRNKSLDLSLSFYKDFFIRYFPIIQLTTHMKSTNVDEIVEKTVSFQLKDLIDEYVDDEEDVDI